ncbi:hypothetical protein [Planomonospora venezuelensis]|uniref:Uncharacterized protein n=1 Tax=Planomonospora venezuelensis TaxID=1999 RepID=A0A841D788_PLAVE|nr:hypothetical protein [Planomonospora venezuelensis]MBB5964364.1 hypothetical protein [Planomonospora venezuelensis]GIN05112.1 hypothetical protein Pve01_67700 [Planomonospora venezuelensis]
MGGECRWTGAAPFTWRRRRRRAAAPEAVCLAEPRRTLLTLWADGERVADAADGVSPFPVTAVGVTAGRAPDERAPTRVDFHDFRLGRF